GPAASPHGPGDDPRGALKARAAAAPFPLLDGNLIDSATGGPPAWPNVTPTALVTAAGLKVGVVGVTTTGTARTTLAANFVGLATRALAPAVAEAARTLRRQGAVAVIAVAHAGGECKAFGDPHDLSSCVGDSEIFQVPPALAAGAVDARVDAIV